MVKHGNALRKAWLAGRRPPHGIVAIEDGIDIGAVERGKIIAVIRWY